MIFQQQLKQNPLQTKQDFERALIELAEPVYHLMAEQKTPGRVHLSDSGSVYNVDRRDIEGFLRTLWGFGPLFSNAQETIEYQSFFKQINQGILTGTNPNDSLYWGTLHDYDQLFVEMGALATYLIFTKDTFWSTLNATEQHYLFNWLDQINQHTIPNTNWLFFRILVNTFFETVDLLASDQQLLTDLAEIEQYYLADGWYFDGYVNQIDYYIPFGMQYYGLLYAKLTPRKNCPYAEQFKQRGGIFAQSFKEWFTMEGVALPFGRSLAYRFAQSSYFAIAAFAGIDCLNVSIAETKYLLSKNMHHWFQQPIFTAEGYLSIGYYYPNLVMAEGYNAPGSPYWSFKNFIILAIDDEASFWQTTPQAPTFSLKKRNPHSRMLLVHSPNQNELQAFTAGQHSHEHAHGEAKYEKFVYSTTFGFSVSKGATLEKQGAFDNTLAVSESDTHYRTVFGYKDYAIHENYVYACWQPWPNVTIKTFLIPCYPWHLRLHLIETERDLSLICGGFSAPQDGFEIKATPDFVAYQSSKGIIGIKDLSKKLTCQVTYPEPNTNLLYSKTALVSGKTQITAGNHTLLLACLGDAQAKEVAPFIHAHLEQNVLHYTYDNRDYALTLKESVLPA